MKLSELPINTVADIIYIPDDENFHRLISMGISIGKQVMIVRKHFNMIHFRINTVEFAIRLAMANKIIVKAR